jgi:hypothetical protein
MSVLTVLEDEEKSTEEETPSNLGLLESSERLPEASANSAVESVDLSIDKANLLNDVDILSVKVSHPAKVLDSLVALALGEQPSRRLRNKDGTDEKKTSRNELDSKGDQPDVLVLARGVREVLVDSVVDPETNESTGLPSDFVETDKTTSYSRRGQF